MEFKFLPHTADVKFQAFGKNYKEVFKNSALALFSIIYDKKIKEKKTIKIKVKGSDLENLLSNFLEEFVVLFDSKHFLPAKIKKLFFDEKKLIITAEIVGDDVRNYKISTYIKAITYHKMFIKKQKNNFIAQVVLDV